MMLSVVINSSSSCSCRSTSFNSSSSSLHTIIISSRSSPLGKCRPTTNTTPAISASSSSPPLRRRRHHRRRPNQAPSYPSLSPAAGGGDDGEIKVVIDTETLMRSARNMLEQFVDSGSKALNDLSTLITVDEGRKNVVISCRRPTLVFVGNLTLFVLLFLFASRALFKFGQALLQKLTTISNNIGGDDGLVVYRRDRSLGGRQVAVARKNSPPPPSTTTSKIDATRSHSGSNSNNISNNNSNVTRTRRKERLPSWWPVSLPPPVVTTNEGDMQRQRYQTMANRMIRAILDQRIHGNDISEHDIVQFRRLCRACGVSVFIDTVNARDSVYRASVDFVLRMCERMLSHSNSVSIDGEDSREFVAGIATNIGLDSSVAARIVIGAVAARTRSCFLQAWALEMQGKHSEAVEELSKICLLHRIFPPDENSPEMEMVARGLEKHLKIEQRKFLLGVLVEICNGGNHSSMSEALGLVSQPEGIWDQHESQLT